ncbi:NAD-dependent epimerase/dehydratase family protein [bacterium]|nr:NAD-dependent epimerase/dehydratase family protein [bacterium]
MASVLVTGGAGFIGGTIVRRLLADGHQVRVLDNLSTGRQENLDGLDVEFVRGDIRDESACRLACHKVERVIHQAALISVPQSVEDPHLAAEINIVGSINVFRQAIESGATRIVYASSCAVYGEADAEYIDEATPPKPLSPYAATKLADEAIAESFAHCYGAAFVGLRYFNVFGPRQDPKSPYAAAIPSFLSRVLSRRAPVIHGDGLQTRDFVFVEDVARANVMAAFADLPGNEIFNIARGDSTSILDLANLLIELAGGTAGPEFEAARVGDIRNSRASVARARERLGFSAEFSVREGLAQTVDWYRGLIR